MKEQGYRITVQSPDGTYCCRTTNGELIDDLLVALTDVVLGVGFRPPDGQLEWVEFEKGNKEAGHGD
jgi:hypothetical protein